MPWRASSASPRPRPPPCGRSPATPQPSAAPRRRCSPSHPGCSRAGSIPPPGVEQLTAPAEPADSDKHGELADGEGCPPSEPAQVTFRPGTKQALIAGLLAREQGATLDELIAATGWLPHTTRAALTGLRRKGFALDKSSREDGKTAYRIEPPDKAAAHDAVSGGAA